MRQLYAVMLVLMVSACATAPKPVYEPNPAQVVEAVSAVEQLLRDGYEFLSNRQLRAAIAKFDEALALCPLSATSAGSGARIYASRSLAETLYYVTAEAADSDTDAVVTNVDCSDALYLRGYAELDTGAIDAAKRYIEQALLMAPKNSLYLSELGHIYHVQRKWQLALDTFSEAESAAVSFSPDGVKAQELARAKRGIGFSLIELGQLQQAEQKFNEVLAINPDDKAAQQELLYIDYLRNEAKPRAFETVE